MPIDYTQVQKLYEEGCNDREISEITNIHKCTVFAWRRNHNLPPHTHRRKTQTELRLVKELYNEGYSDNSIAKMLNRQPCTIGYWRKQLGLQAKFKAFEAVREEVDEANKPWSDPESLFCDPEFLETITGKPVKRYKLDAIQ